MHIYDVIVIGGGPAGLSCAINAASEGLSVLVIEKNHLGGQARLSAEIKNYMGFPSITGRELITSAVRQALEFDVKFSAAEVKRFDTVGNNRFVYLANGNVFAYKTLVIATGVTFNQIDIPELNTCSNVHYGVDVTEHLEDCRDKTVIVMGGANSSGQAALALAKVAKSVHIIARRAISDTMSVYLIQALSQNYRVTIHQNTTIAGINKNDNRVAALNLTRNGYSVDPIECDNLYVFIGSKPSTEWLQPYIACSEDGYIHVDNTYMTNYPGIFAIGDITAGSIKRIANAVGQGACVVSSIHKYLKGV
jgi:thioredoxin reductase (NADPH)